MSTLWKKSQQNSITVDLSTDDIYGADGFKCNYTKLSDGSSAEVDSSSWSEITKPINDNNCTADGATDKGSTKIKVKDTDDNNKVENFAKGDVFKVKDKEIYGYIEEVDVDNGYLVVRTPLSDDIASDDEIDRVGNTGVYQVSLTLDDVDVYTFITSNPSIDLQNEVIKIEVSEYEDKLDEIISKLNTKYPRAKVYA